MSADNELEILSESEVDLGDLREGRTGDVLAETTATTIVPKRGPIFDADGWCSISVIRPCMSRGAALRGMRPIYTPQMLEANARVFDGALMYVDHLSESGLSESEIEVILAESRRTRKVDEMGGRVKIEGRGWDALFIGPDDDTFGYQPGSVIGRAKPTPKIRAIVENDPELLHVSINAYPTSARKGAAPWDPTKVGMIVEGIRSTPNPTVDWVPRGGAGGRVYVPEPALEEDRSTVYLGGHHYSQRDPDVAAPGRNPSMALDLSQIHTPEALREAVAAEAPHLVEGVYGRSGVREGMSAAEVQSAIREAVAAERAAADLSLDGLREEFDEGLEIREAVQIRSTSFERRARTAIDAAGLPPRLAEGLYARYGVTEHGIGSGLLSEAADPAVAWSEVDSRLQADIADAFAIVQEAQGGSSVTGLGGSRPTVKERRTAGTFRNWLQESAEGDVDDDAVKNLVITNQD